MRRWIETRLVRLTEWIWKLIPKYYLLWEHQHVKWGFCRNTTNDFTSISNILNCKEYLINIIWTRPIFVVNFQTSKMKTLNVEFADCSTRSQPVCCDACVLADIVHFDLMNIHHGQAVLVPEIILFVLCIEFHVFVIPVVKTARTPNNCLYKFRSWYSNYFFQTWRWQTRRNYNTSQCSPEGQHDKPSPPSECRTLAWLAEQRFGRLWPPSLLRCWANQADARQVRVSGYKRTNERTNEQTDRRIASSR